MIDFDNLVTFTTPEGAVHEIHFENNTRVWKDPNHILNRVKSAVDIDQSIYNGCGYIEGNRLSSSGNLKAQTGSVATGFIPFKIGDIIRMSGVKWSTTVSTGYVYIVFYDSNFSYLSHINRYENGSENDSGISNAGNNIDKSKSSILTDDNGVVMFNIDFSQTLNIAYIRISASGNGNDLIVTKNEEITEGVVQW